MTQEQWQAITGDNPSHFKGEKLPVEQDRGRIARRFAKSYRNGRDNYVLYRPKRNGNMPAERERQHHSLLAKRFRRIRRTLTATRSTAKVRRVNTTRIQHRWAVLLRTAGVYSTCTGRYGAVSRPVRGGNVQVGQMALPHGPEDARNGRAGLCLELLPRGCRSAIRSRNPRCSRRSFLGFRVCLRLDQYFYTLLPCYPLFFFDVQNAETVLTVDSMNENRL